MSAAAAGRSERGVALIVVILVMIVVAILASAIVISTMTGVRGGSASAARSISQRAIDDGTELYRVALEQGLANESNGWIPSAEHLRQVLGDRGQVVSLASLTGLDAALRRPVPGAPADAVRMRAGDDGTYRFWQLVRVTGPGHGGDGTVTAWIRGWHGAADGTTGRRPVLARVSLTPGAFHQFQLLVDGPIRFDDGATITGPVHSNGRDVGAGEAIAPLPGAAVACSGEFARLSTADGAVASSMPASCRRVASAGLRSFASVRETFDRVHAAGTTGGTGIMVANPGGPGYVPVRFNGTSVDVGGTVRPIGSGLTVLVQGDVVVSGTAQGRVTVASDPPGARAGTILVDGDVRAAGPAAAVGLYTEGDVVVSSSPCVGRLEAAVIATRGTLTIDRGYRTELVQLDAARCGNFSFHGSIAAAEGPVLRWTWPNGAAAGYETRRWEWNPRLVHTPPPWTPVLEGWQVRDQREASPGCGIDGGWGAGCT